jgi:subtilisin family serine protease
MKRALHYIRDCKPLELEILPKTISLSSFGIADGDARTMSDTNSLNELMKRGVPHHVATKIRPGQSAYRAGSATLVDSSRISVRYDGKITKKEIYEIFKKMELTVLWETKAIAKLFLLRAKRGRDIVKIASELMKDKNCRYASPDFLEACGQRGNPDPVSPLQWQWRLIRCESPWNTGLEGQGIRIAVLDRGFHLGHPDLIGSVIRSGYFEEDFNQGGPAFFSNNPSNIPFDLHGTQCAALAVGRANDTGGIGVAPKAGFIPISTYTLASANTYVRAILYAANPQLEDRDALPSDGAHVISCSLPPSEIRRPDIEDAIHTCARLGRGGLGTPFFYAVDNSATLVDDDPIASIDNVIAVGSSSSIDYPFVCARGSKLEYLAPGASVVVSGSGGSAELANGTSFATPIAAGIAALVIQKNGSIKLKELRSKLQNSCIKIRPLPYPVDSGRNDLCGFGRLDAQLATS